MDDGEEERKKKKRRRNGISVVRSGLHGVNKIPQNPQLKLMKIHTRNTLVW